ncbi:MAG: pyridoxamine 5'-phosphate oxidase family protein [Bacteroidota bacterium]
MAEAMDLAREIMEAVQKVHVLATVDAQGRPQMRWMGALVEDPEAPWTFYLACSAGSRKMQQIATNPRAQLLFSKLDTWQVASLSGEAEAVDSPELRQMIWEAVPVIAEYYSGPNDPNMAIIRFKTCCGEVLAMQEGMEPVRFEA